LLAAFEDNNGARKFIWVLDSPREPKHEIFELCLVAWTDDSPDVAQQALLFLPSLARLNPKAAPKVELV
jgi:hypothetical protein